MNGIVLGTGIDLVECARIEKSLRQFGEKFTQRIFLPAELDYCMRQKHPCRHLAARFAAKEAVSKAFATGIGSKLGWLDIEIVRDPHGAPQLQLHDKGADLLQSLGANKVWISLTHTDHYAAASAIITCS